MNDQTLAFEALPLVTERWHDLEILFEKHGAPDDCWCMWWRVQKKQFEAQQGQGNKDAMNGATIVEGYPIDLQERSCSDADAYYGALSIYEKAGFEEVVRRSPTRPVMRYFVRN